MGKIGPIFLILILNVLELASGEHLKETKTESTSHRRNGEVSSHDIDRILKRLEDSENLAQRLLDRVELLEDRDEIQQEEIRNLKIALDRHSENDASAPRRVWSQELTDRRFESSSRSVPHVRPAGKNDDNSKPLPSRRIARIQSTVQRQRIRQLSNDPSHVAFLATLSKHQEHIGVHQPVIFDNVVTNIGNAYHNHLGSFIAPFQGTYVLSATLMSQHQTDGHFAFTKNGTPITYMYLSGPEGGYSTSSQTAVLQLQQGDDVNIHNIDADRPVYGFNYCIFSGFLLFEEENPGVIG